jgi:hypothetical protein
VKADLRYWPAVGDEVWDRIRSDYGLPALDEVTARLESLHSDPDPVLRRLVRVFIADGTYCPGFQFHPDGTPDQRALDLFEKALALKVPHNVFAAWMVTPLAAGAPRPADVLEHAERLGLELEAFARNRP